MTWDYSDKSYKKQANNDILWDLERKILYSNEKIDPIITKQYLNKLNIPEKIKSYLKFLLV